MIEQLNVSVCSSSKNFRELLSSLTDRQCDVLSCMLFEHSREQEMNTLKIKEATLIEHRRNILKKMQIQHPMDLINLLKLKGNEDILYKLRLRFIALKQNSTKLPMQASSKNKIKLPALPEKNQVNQKAIDKSSVNSLKLPNIQPTDSQISLAILAGMMISNIFFKDK